jgi:hypothetical protein
MIGEWWSGKDVEGSGRGLEGSSKTTKNLSQDSRSSGQDLKPGHAEYEAGLSTTRLRCSVFDELTAVQVVNKFLAYFT